MASGAFAFGLANLPTIIEAAEKVVENAAEYVNPEVCTFVAGEVIKKTGEAAADMVSGGMHAFYESVHAVCQSNQELSAENAWLADVLNRSNHGEPIPCEGGTSYLGWGATIVTLIGGFAYCARPLPEER